MAGSVAKAYVQVIPSAEGIKGKLSGVFGKEMPSAGQSAGGLFGDGLVSKIKNIIVTAGIGKMLSEAVQAGAAMEQSLGGIETLFKDSADIVIKNAEQAYRTAGMSANSYMEMVTGFSASLLQGLSGDTEKAASIADMALTDMSDNANKMGTDMVLIQNAYQGFAKQNYTMLDNLKLGYGGTKTEMQRLLADAEKLTGVKYDISNLADVYSAIHEIQKEMKISGITAEEAAELVASGAMTEAEAFELLGTTAKEATTTLSGSLASMKAAFSDLLANLTLGRDIGPSLQALSQTVFTFLGNLLPAVGKILKGIPDVLIEALNMAVQGLNLAGSNAGLIAEEGIAVVVKLTEAIVSALPYLLEAGYSILAALGETILTMDWSQIGIDMMSRLKENMDLAAGEILGTDGNIVQSILGAVRAGLPTVVEAGGTIATGVANGIIQYVPMVLESGLSLLGEFSAILLEQLPQLLIVGEGFVNTMVDGIVASVPGLVQTALNLCVEFINNILSQMPAILESGKNLLLKLVDGIRQMFPQLLSSAGDAVIKLLAGITSNLPSILKAGFDLISELIVGIGNAFPDILVAAGELVNKLWNAIIQTDWLQLGKDIINGLINGLGQMGNALWEAAKQVAYSVLDSIKKALGIASPSKVMAAEVGRFIPPGVAVGVKGNTKPLTDAMEDLSALTTDTLKTDLDITAALTNTASVPIVPREKRKNLDVAELPEFLIGILEEFTERNIEAQNATIVVLREILEAILGIHFGDEDIYNAGERYRTKMNVATGGAVW